MPTRGDVREDGRIFWGYRGTEEDWRTPKSYRSAIKSITLRNKRLRYNRGRWLDIYKVAKGCEECGYRDHPKALQFDHLDRNKKHKNIANMKDGSLKKLIEEVRKCRILCANCHFIHSDNQRKEDV